MPIHVTCLFPLMFVGYILPFRKIGRKKHPPISRPGELSHRSQAIRAWAWWLQQTSCWAEHVSWESWKKPGNPWESHPPSTHIITYPHQIHCKYIQISKQKPGTNWSCSFLGPLGKFDTFGWISFGWRIVQLHFQALALPKKANVQRDCKGHDWRGNAFFSGCRCICKVN